MPKYKVGDKVRVRDDLVEDVQYWMEDGSDYWYFYGVDMEALLGKVVTITEARTRYYNVIFDGEEVEYWADEMFVGLAEEETPKKPVPKFKIGDRVEVVIKIPGELKVGDTGTIIAFKNNNPGVEFDRHCGGHDCDGMGKVGHCWWILDHKIIKYETPTPEPIQVNVNVTVNINYDNACWYCRKGGLVDLYLAGAMGICPHCGRVCNTPKQETVEYPPLTLVTPAKKENKPLTTEELEALPDGTRVFTVWMDCKDPWKNEFTRWRIKKGSMLDWETGDGTASIGSNNRYYLAYLEEPDKSEVHLPEREWELPF